MLNNEERVSMKMNKKYYKVLIASLLGMSGLMSTSLIGPVEAVNELSSAHHPSSSPQQNNDMNCALIEPIEPIPFSPLSGTYASTTSGVPIRLDISYGESIGDLYTFSLTLTAGQYWYRFFWDYGPDEATQINFQLTNVKTGKVSWTGFEPLCSYSGGNPSFYDNGRVRYATNALDKLYGFSRDFCLTGVKIIGQEGRMFVGPTTPMWTGRSDEQTWQWL